MPPENLTRTLEIHPTEKQYLAWQALQNPDIAEIYFGGAAGGGKSWLGCESRLVRAYAYPGYKSYIGRNELTRLMASTYITFTKVCKFHNIPASDWHLNGKYNYIEFKNGSRIDLLDLAFKPSDPMFERFGSLEYTDGGWVDEAGEVHFMAIDILRSRGGRHLNTEFGLSPDSLYTFNPNKGWVYRIYRADKEGKLPPDSVFIQALYKDNPHTEEIYGKQLARIQDSAMRARLRDGSFEYDSDPAMLMTTDTIIDLFTNAVPASEEKYMIIDVARHGVDKTVVYLFRGLKLYGVRIYQKQDTAVTSTKTKMLAREEMIPFSHCLADEDGIGGAVVDQNQGFKGFIANSVPLDNPITEERENYANLKAQCSYKLAEMVNTHKIAIDVTPEAFHSEVNGLTYEVWKEMLIEELENIKSKESEGKLRVMSKDEVKEAIGRSPDFSDTLMMRMRFEYKDKLENSTGVRIYRPNWKGFNRRV